MVEGKCCSGHPAAEGCPPLLPGLLTCSTCIPPLCLQVSNMENSNTRSELEAIKNQVLQQLQSLPPVPSVPIAVMPAGTKVSQGFGGLAADTLAGVW